MAFFNKRRAKRTVTLKVEEVKVATATIISSYNDETGAGPRCVKWYFLVWEANGKYYEIFSGKQIKKESDTHHDGFTSKTFDTPYIKKLEPLTNYLINPKEKVVELQLLFDFILNLNVQERLTDFNNIEE